MGEGAQAGSVSTYRAFWALLLHVWVVFPSLSAFANNIQITNLTVHPYSGGNGEVEFDLSWSNSWRVATEPYNWDAAWVFCKLRRNGGDWTHLKLKTTGHTIPSSPLAISTSMGLVDTGAAHDASTNPAVGIFMYRTNDGFGTFTANDIKLQWSYADNGASSGDVIEIRVVGVEMVYIPEGAFYAGDNATSYGAFKQGSGDSDPWYISSENSISVTNAVSDGYYYVTDSYPYDDATGATFTIPAAFPKGYGAVYVTKGELSQGQWVAFFNTLTNTQKTTRDVTDVASASGKKTDNLTLRNNVSWTSGEATLPDQGGGATYTSVAMNYISWADLLAYLDWSGLRPMSELEFEKTGRGPNTPVSGEYSWGSTNITGATSITDGGSLNERGQSGSNIAYGNVVGVQGPLRVGSFAKGVATREASGGGFYGVMELSGNLWEWLITVVSTTGRAFEGRYHGDGLVGASGDANVATWPGTSSTGSGSEGAGLRGGGWDEGASRMRLSDRIYAAYTTSSRRSYRGGHGVRSAP